VVFEDVIGVGRYLGIGNRLVVMMSLFCLALEDVMSAVVIVLLSCIVDCVLTVLVYVDIVRRGRWR
jgi:hypothetical protein